MESGEIVRREVQTRVQNQFTEVLLFIPLLYRKGTVLCRTMSPDSGAASTQTSFTLTPRLGFGQLP